MKSKILFRHVAVALGLSVAMTGGAAAALVTTWDYTQEFEFTNATGATLTNNPTNDRDDIVGGTTKLQWGNSPFSSLVINPEAADSTTPSNALTQGIVTTSLSLSAVFFEDGPAIAHNNNPITGTTLTTATARDFVRLIPLTPPGGAIQEQSITFDVLFDETANNLTGDACSWNIPDTAFCSDIFVIDGGIPGTPTLLVDGDTSLPTLAFKIDTFDRDGFRYDVYLNEKTNALVTLSDEACAKVSTTANPVGPGCVGWVTEEEGVTIARLQFAIVASEIPVPAPGTLLLLSGGLIGLGAALRRKSRNASA